MSLPRLVRPLVALCLSLGLCLVAACAPAGTEEAVAAASTEGDLPIGERLDADKADGQWGAALTCKPVPNLPRLTNPELVVSLYGLSVRLIDRTTGFEKVFAAGVGAIESKATESTFGDSRTAFPLIATGKSDFVIPAAAIQPCKTWWTDPETGAKSPVFAGLPFMPFYGGYALHGPIDNFRAPNGGSLRRGFVSHGCVRMESADILEIYARVRGVAKLPVRVQREPDRRADGRRVDVASPWVGTECQKDSDCGFAGGFCKANRYSGRAFCTTRCSGGCADRAGAPTTFCAADPDAPGSGMCVLRRGGAWPDCRALDAFVPVNAPRQGGTAARADVCLPGSQGWVGDRCLAAADCKSGTRCAMAAGAAFGVCTQACTAACADQPTRPTTFCAVEPRLAATGGACARTCTPASNAPECAAGTTCVQRSRPGSTRSAFVCVPG